MSREQPEATFPLESAATLGTLMLHQVEHDLCTLGARLQLLCDVVLPGATESEADDGDEPANLPAALRTIAECVQDHLFQARQALAELAVLAPEPHA